MAEPDYERIGRAVMALLERLETVEHGGTWAEMLAALRTSMDEIGEAIPENHRAAAARALEALGQRTTDEERAAIRDHVEAAERALAVLEDPRS